MAMISRAFHGHWQSCTKECANSVDSAESKTESQTQSSSRATNRITDAVSQTLPSAPRCISLLDSKSTKSFASKSTKKRVTSLQVRKICEICGTTQADSAASNVQTHREKKHHLALGTSVHLISVSAALGLSGAEPDRQRPGVGLAQVDAKSTRPGADPARQDQVSGLRSRSPNGSRRT